MKFSLNIETGNAALAEDGASEHLAELVAQVAESVRDGSTSGYVRDYNGNGVGYWEYVPEVSTDNDDDE